MGEHAWKWVYLAQPLAFIALHEQDGTNMRPPRIEKLVPLLVSTEECRGVRISGFPARKVVSRDRDKRWISINSSNDRSAKSKTHAILEGVSVHQPTFYQTPVRDDFSPRSSTSQNAPHSVGLLSRVWMTCRARSPIAASFSGGASMISRITPAARSTSP